MSTRPEPFPYQRVMVYGVTGSGKTTAAARLAGRTGLPWWAIDELTWDADWTPVAADEQRRRVSEICAGERWIIDHGYGQWLDVPVGRADLVVALDYPRPVSLAALVTRSLTNVATGRDTCNGNRETWHTLVADESIVRWHFRSFARKRARIRGWVADSPGPDVKRFTSRRQLADWLRSYGPVD
ncbi:adenylate kinase [Propionibacteriaceae bacterium Y2011]|uniref:adenylate kinase n=1 Tax=Microlunatus sp. Y2014 TaxID=3418488 RepID=UPI003B4B5D49